MAHRSLDQLDKKILRLIADDARIPFLEVARECNVSGAAIHQRIQKLTNLGILKGSQFVIDPEKIGYETCAYMGLNLKNPENFDDVVEALLILFGVGFMLTQRDLQPASQHRLQQLAHCLTDTTITLPDGTRVDLQAGSSLSIADDFGRSSRVVAMSGQAFFDVATDSDRLFTVEAGQLHAVVHGTSFNVLAHPGQAISEITVSSGCVEVKKAYGGHSFGRYRHGDQITYDASTGRESVGKVDVGDMTEWRSHEFHLTDATLPQFREKMRRYFGVEVTVAQGAISPSARINCSVTTTRPTVGNVMEAVCTIFGASYRQQGSRVIIYPANNI